MSALSSESSVVSSVVSDVEVVSHSDGDSCADSERLGGGGDGGSMDDGSRNDSESGGPRGADSWLGSLFGCCGESNSGSRKLEVAKKESRWVRHSKLIVVMLIIATAAGVTAGAYLIVRDSETSDFEESYEELTDSMARNAKFAMNNLLEAMASHSSYVTGEMVAKQHALMALANNSTNSSSITTSEVPPIVWPNVSLADYEITAFATRMQAGVENLYLSPILRSADDLAPWAAFSGANFQWIDYSISIGAASPEASILPTHPGPSEANYVPTAIVPHIFDYLTASRADLRGYRRHRRLEELEEEQAGSAALQMPDPIDPAKYPPPYLPSWQVSPPQEDNYFVNADLYRMPGIEPLFQALEHPIPRGIFGPVVADGFKTIQTTSEIRYHNLFHESRRRRKDDHGETALSSDHVGAYDNTEYNYAAVPHATFMEPVYENLYDTSSQLEAVLIAELGWDVYLVNLIPAASIESTNVSENVTVILKNNCNQEYTFFLVGSEAYYMGPVDLHDPKFDKWEVVVPFYEETLSRYENVSGHCLYSFYIYPTTQYEEQFYTDLPIYLAVAMAVVFVMMLTTFLVYDFFVWRRNDKVVEVAARSEAIVASMFPSNVRERLFEDNGGRVAPGTKSRLKSFLSEGVIADPAGGDNNTSTEPAFLRTKPIADLFPATTILFADIAGFTAWSSAREPTQVFTLLETIYAAFDEIAKKRRVFKVETVGDCYVAVTGLPDPRSDHAVAMARFARDCMHRMQALTRKLEVTLGPDTADLSIRVGIHSGPVTAGVLRGERSRFQLFGDTMNTASRMESTGLREKIQISQDTADLLIAAGKSSWITPREEMVVAKGKGEMCTFWLQIGTSQTARSEQLGSEASQSGDVFESLALSGSGERVEMPSVSAKEARLIQWNVEILLNLLRQLEAKRDPLPPGTVLPPVNEEIEDSMTVLEEVKEIIHLPKYETKASRNADSIEFSSNVTEQLHEYVAAIASMYRDNPFHNFEHASHVTMSVVKLMSRIVAPDLVGTKEDIMSSLHDHTYGITSDPITQFACVFSALIHDVDHTGVPNTQLLNENAKLALYYKERSVAEQNSVDLSWDLLMDDNFKDLRAVIYRTEEERNRFRELVVNSVMATDIMDKDLKKLRNARWEKAFSGMHFESEKDAVDRKATIVIEHLIQASDVSHTMQHWHIYRKWNARLFEEMLKAFNEGRAEKDPSEFWYKGEIGFFDFYIIPLAKKLKECGVFGVSSDEYLNYAMKNRQEWEERGQEIVAEMVEALNQSRPA